MRKPVLLGGLLSALFAPVAFAQTPTTASRHAATVNTPTVTDVPRVDADIVDRWQARRRGLGPGRRSRPGLRDLARRQHAAPGEDHRRASATPRTRCTSRFRAEDPDPGEIRALLRDRDAAYRDDFLGIIVDTFDDQRRAYEFFVNPLGVQMDLIKRPSDRQRGRFLGRPVDQRRAHHRGRLRGRDAHSRSPRCASSDSEGSAALGAELPAHPPAQLAPPVFQQPESSRDSNCFICTFDKFDGLAGVQPGRNLEIVPTMTVATSRGTRRAPASRGKAKASTSSPGVDVSWAPTPNLTLNGTLNPDFSQVETDQAQLNLNTSFALFFPEKRPFFLEGADYFNTPFAGALHAPGRGSGWRPARHRPQRRQPYGAFVARTPPPRSLVPGVLGSSFRTSTRQPTSPSAAIATTSTRTPRSARSAPSAMARTTRNDVAGVDGRWQKGIHTLTRAIAAQRIGISRSPRLRRRRAAATPCALHYNFGNRNWFGTVANREIDPGFRADLGFIGQVGFDQALVGGGHNWFGEEGAKISQHHLYGDWDITHRFDGQLLERELEGYFRINAGPMQTVLQRRRRHPRALLGRADVRRDLSTWYIEHARAPA